jgi:transcriptional regulator with XRE-family HTH domain
MVKLQTEEEELRAIIGNRIRQLRELRGVTQVQLATAIGMNSTGAVSQVENGSKGMKLTSLLKAADFLKIHIAFLISPESIDEDELKIIDGLISLCNQRRKK